MTSEILGLGVLATSDGVRLYYAQSNDGVWKLHTATSTDGVELHTHSDHPIILDHSSQEISPEKLTSFVPRKTLNGFELTYSIGDDSTVFCATSSDGVTWKTNQTLMGLSDPMVRCPDVGPVQYAFVGKSGLHLATSRDGLTWETDPRPFLQPLDDKYGQMQLSPQLSLLTASGILVIYLAKGREGDGAFYSLHAIFLDPKDPTRVVQQSHPLWEQSDAWIGSQVSPVGVIYYDRKLISYWDFHREGLFAITHTALKAVETPQVLATNLERLTQNPLLTPISAHYWESKATFNPAAVTIDGKVHLLYRAIGDNDVSVMGYAVSSDGVTFERLPLPAYVPRESFEGAPDHPRKLILSEKHLSPYESGGGGWGGCEDPRLTQIGDTLYLVYVAYNGWGPPRVALSSITVENFVNHVWEWAKPVLISPPGVVDKNAVVFPEKINGKFVILHRIFPDILLDYVDSLEFDGSTYLKGEYKISPTRSGWDNRKVGAGAPPIKTKDGWLLIYHSVGEADPGRYKMGAMLLDLQDPTKVLYRTISPILAPDHDHENIGWKAGVAYPCGAVVVDGNLYVYYGGADMVVCAATANLDSFIRELKDSGTVVLSPINMHTTHKVK